MAKKKTEEQADAVEASENTESQPEQEQAEEQTSIVENVTNTVSAAFNAVVEGAADIIEVAANALGVDSKTSAEVTTGRRAQKIGTVFSDKMTKTVVVRVDRQIMHPKYRRYIRRTSKFMAHDEMGASIGDKVRIEETRPLSARKRWRVIEIIQKAAR